MIAAAKATRLVILQSSVQAQDYGARNRREGDLVLAVGAGARYESESRNWPTCLLSDLWTADEYCDAVEKNRSSLLELIADLDRYGAQASPETPLELGRYFAFQLWVILGQLRYNACAADALYRAMRDRPILCYTKRSRETFLELRPDPDCTLADALRAHCQFDPERCEFESTDETAAATRNLREQILATMPETLRNWLRRARDRYALGSSSADARKLLLIGGWGEWARVSRIKPFRRKFGLHLPPSLSAPGEIEPPEELITLVERALPHRVRAREVAAFLEAHRKLFASHAERVRSFVRSYDAVVACVLTFPRDGFLAHMAALEGKPVIVWQHGEKGQAPDDATADFTELYYATHYFAYADGVTRRYRTLIGGERRLRDVRSIGTIERQTEWRGGSAIVYATGKWFGMANNCQPSSDPDRRQYDAHRAILRYLETVGPPHHSIFKSNNTPRLNDVPYATTNVTVDYVTPFSTLLKTAQAVILDTPATTLVEACATEVPIFVLGGRAPYTDEFLELVSRRVVWRDSAEQLVVALDAFLKTGDYPADRKDRSYIDSFCGSGTPSDVCLRACQALEDAIAL